MLRGYLREQKWLTNSYPPKAHPSMGESSQKLETWNSLHRLHTAQQVERCLLQVLFQAVLQVSTSSRQLVCSQSLLCRLACLTIFSFIATQGCRILVNLINFWNFLKLFWVVCLSFCLRRFPEEPNVNFSGNIYNTATNFITFFEIRDCNTIIAFSPCLPAL